MNSPANSPFTVRFRGVRGSIPVPADAQRRYGGNTSCLEVRCGEQLLILDAGTGLRTLGDDLLRAPNPCPIEAAILLSHTHWDHIQGLPFFAPAYRDHNRVTLYAPHRRAAQVQSALDNQMHPIHFPVPMEEMRGLRPVEQLSPSATRIGAVEIETIELNHPGGCAGFKLRFGEAAIAYLPDHEPYRAPAGQLPPSAQRQLIKFLHGVDVLILDTQYTAEEYEKRAGWGHGCLPDSVRLALDAAARHLVLFHHDPTHTDEELDAMVATARAMANGSGLTIEAAAENQVLTIDQPQPCPVPIPPTHHPTQNLPPLACAAERHH